MIDEKDTCLDVLQKIVKSCFGSFLEFNGGEPNILPEHCDICPMETFWECMTESYKHLKINQRRKVRGRYAYGAF